MIKPNFMDCTMYQLIARGNEHGHMVYHGTEQFPHWHSDLELFLVESGSLTIELGTTMVYVPRGSLCVVPSNVVHTFLSSEKATVFVNARLPLQWLLAYELDDFFKTGYLVKASAKLSQVFKELVFTPYAKLNELFAKAKLLEIATLLMSGSEHILQRIDTDNIKHDTDLTLEIQTFIERGVDQNITLSDLANHLGISENYCSTLVKQQTSFNFKEYVNYVRLREAEKLLRATNLKVSDICFSAGFNSIPSFNRNFKNFKGVSPTEFRKYAQGNGNT